MKVALMNTALALTMAAVAPPATAATLTYNLDAVDTSDGTPAGSAPWIRAVFSSLAANRVLLQIETMAWTNSGQFLNAIGFNSNLGRAIAVQSCRFDLCDGLPYGTAPQAQSTKTGSISPGGTFGIVLDYPQSNGAGSDRFGRGEYANYLLTAPGLTVANFDAFSVTKKKAGFKTYAHLQGSSDGAKIFDNTPEYCASSEISHGYEAAEPGACALLGSGLLGLVFWRPRLTRLRIP